MADRPRLLLIRSNFDKSKGNPFRLEVSDASTGVAGHVSIRPHHATTEALSPPLFTSTHLAPSFVSRGGSAIRLQRAFQLAPEFLATSRQSGFHCANADLERRSDLLVCKTFNIPENHSFAINTAQATQRLL